MVHNSTNRRSLTGGLLWMLLAAPLFLQAQPAARTYCNYNYPEIGFAMGYFCDARQIGKNDTAIAYTYEQRDRSNQSILYEQSMVVFQKYKTRRSASLQEIEKQGRAALENRLSQMRTPFKITTSKTITGEGYEPTLRYTNEGMRYTHYTYIETSAGNNFALEYVINFYFDNGFVAATSIVECLKKLSASEAAQYKSNTPPAFASFATRPTNIEYKTSGRYQVSSSAVGLSFELAQHNLEASESAEQKTVLIDYCGISQDNRAAYGAQNPITLKLVKKLGVNDKFATIAAPYLKESFNNELNGYDAKKYPAFKNMVIFKKRWEYMPGRFYDHPEPYRYLFEYNGYVYDLAGENPQKAILDSLLKTIQVYKGAPTTAATTPATGTNANEAFNRDLLLGMEEWLKDQFATVKGREKPSNTLGALMTKRFETTLKLGSYPTEIVEEGLAPDKRRDWTGTLGSFDSKANALKMYNDWQKTFSTFKHELFQLKLVRKTEDEVVWSPHQLQQGLPPQFSKMELRLRLKESFLVENGKMVTRYEVLLTTGSKL
ncbi:MAG TPA: hypothetical protein PKE63_01080 [Lacibacter sp.]|nr:hypothetical protein [Lacibacter sp.]HMO90157.1 hypothetical protein [Lacibacter sp.]HMP85834.1 hypothetical protein [Lacibacter sp.]